ncbi:uncharacterized protein DS421_13g417120 [Arachis hypogaea]|nr:uncharacterized protein DS421_13g417120 [Arachis hypogaea]
MNPHFLFIPLLVFPLSFALQSLFLIEDLVSNVAVTFGLILLNISSPQTHGSLFPPRNIDAQHLFGSLNVL